MDPLNNINPFDRDFATYNATVTQQQQQQAEFEPHLDEVPQRDAAPVAGMMDEAILASSLEPTVRDHQAPDFGEAVRHLNRRDGYQPAPDELTGSDPLPRHEVLMGEDYTGQLRPAKRQRTLSHPQGEAIERQLSETGNSAGRVLMEDAGPPSPFGRAVGSPLVLPAEGYDQDLLWARMEDAGPSSSLGPTARHPQAPDFGEAVRPLNWRYGHQHAPDELIAAREGSSLLPSQDNRPTSFVINTDRYTALLVPAGLMRQSTPLNPPGAAVRLGSRPENVPQPSARPGNRASPELLGRRMEQAAPASAGAEAMSPAVVETFDASLAVPEDFSHGTQPAPETMLSKLGRWGLLPDAAQPVTRYDIRGERYTAVLGPGGPDDVQLIHHPRVGSDAAPAAPARAPSDV
ncbi:MULTISPECIES: hypothetical protein [unclassified Bradyrhizobium]